MSNGPLLQDSESRLQPGDPTEITESDRHPELTIAKLAELKASPVVQSQDANAAIEHKPNTTTRPSSKVEAKPESTQSKASTAISSQIGTTTLQVEPKPSNPFSSQASNTATNTRPIMPGILIPTLASHSHTGKLYDKPRSTSFGAQWNTGPSVVHGHDVTLSQACVAKAQPQKGIFARTESATSVTDAAHAGSKRKREVDIEVYSVGVGKKVATDRWLPRESRKSVYDDSDGS